MIGEVGTTTQTGKLRKLINHIKNMKEAVLLHQRTTLFIDLSENAVSEYMSVYSIEDEHCHLNPLFTTAL